MVIERITGGKPQEVRKAEKEDVKKSPAPAKKEAEAPKGFDMASSAATVSERSKAAIKAYRIAMESDPYLSRAAKVAQIKSQVMEGTYHPSSGDVAQAILQSIVKGS
ncbi:MAG: flagellar biosynthesis anti-sigma factor FlgM [Nitrospinae bacterium]|nr:flagellar biosynthesis anti-sigma factor FlgM [Nitrospinota bacterium]